MLLPAVPWMNARIRDLMYSQGIQNKDMSAFCAANWPKRLNATVPRALGWTHESTNALLRA